MPELSYLARHPIVGKLLVPAVALICFVLFLVLTFPYESLARRIETEAQREGAELSIGSMGPGGLASVRARDVRLRLPASPGGETPPEVKLERADLSPDLFALILRRTSFGFSVAGYGGTAKGHAALSNDPRTPGLTSLRLDARDVDLAALPVKEMFGIDAGGKLSVKVDLRSMQPVETSTGDVQLTLDGVALSGNLLGMPIPKTSLGKLDGEASVDKGVAKVEKTAARGGDIDADVDGNVSLRPLFSLSQADLHVRIRPSDHWLDSNPTIKNMLGLIANARQADGSYVYTMTGPIAHLQSRPGR